MISSHELWYAPKKFMLVPTVASIAQRQLTVDSPFDDLQWKNHVSRAIVATGCFALVDWLLLRLG